MTTDQTTPKQSADQSAELRCIPSDELFVGAREITIEHNGELYRLRRTSKGKLILTK